jgi:tRNA threonylcarbamoyladenosine biosynthesis protein TsaB
VGLPTLDVLAGNLPFYAGLVCPAIDARRGELYAALYRRTPEGETRRLTDYLSVTPETLLEQLSGPVLFLGDGTRTYTERLKQKTQEEVLFASGEINYPRASVLCRLADRTFSRRGGTHPRDLKALYVRPSDAELNRKAVKQASKNR